MFKTWHVFRLSPTLSMRVNCPRESASPKVAMKTVSKNGATIAESIFIIVCARQWKCRHGPKPFILIQSNAIYLFQVLRDLQIERCTSHKTYFIFYDHPRTCQHIRLN